jgi:flagellar basal-body rod modification protein FlgD
MVIPPSLAVGAIGAATSLLTQGSSSTPTKKNDSLDQADFMKLLMAQLQNQDPMNPMDSANFSAQLAQFSSLEQLTQINQHLAQPDASGTNRVEAVSLLGKQIAGSGSALTIQGGTASGLAYDLTATGTVTATITDASGHEVASLDLGAQSSGAHSLDLKSVPQAPSLPDGTYDVKLEVTDASGVKSQVAPRISGQVTGVDLSADPPVLLIGGARLPLTDVTSVNDANSSTSTASAAKKN